MQETFNDKKRPICKEGDKSSIPDKSVRRGRSVSNIVGGSAHGRQVKTLKINFTLRCVEFRAEIYYYG